MKKWLLQFEAWVFDLDGVLVASEPLHLASWQAVFQRHGMRLGDEFLTIGLGMADSRFYRHIAGIYGLDPEDKTFLREKREHFYESIEARLPAVDGIEPLLERLAGRVRLGVATSSSRQFLDLVLKRFGWGMFDVTLSRDDIAHPKPDPEIYATAAAKLGFAPRECLAIEDTPTGLTSAHAAGLATLAITTNFASEALAPADRIIQNYGEILPLLERFPGQ